MRVKSALLFLLVSLAAATTTAAPGQPFGEIDGLAPVEGAKVDGARGDWIQLFVCRGEKVKAGQRLAVQRNGLGRVVQEYIASSSGRVTVAGRVGLGAIDTTVEIGTLTTGDSCEGADCPAADKN